MTDDFNNNSYADDPARQYEPRRGARGEESSCPSWPHGIYSRSTAVPAAYLRLVR